MNMPVIERKCGCAQRCGDLAEKDDRPLAVCKSLPILREPLLKIVMVPRDAR